MKIEVSFLKSEGGRNRILIITIRLPKDFGIISRETILEELAKRVVRKELVNEWRKSQGKKRLQYIEDLTYIGWSPVISADKLEIIQSYL